MEALTMYDYETGKYVEVYEAICQCGAKLTTVEIKALGTCCESCAGYHTEYHYEQIAQQSNEC